MRIEDAKHVTVHFPEFKSKYAYNPEMTETFTAGDEDDYENRVFSRPTFEANCELWKSRGYDMKLW